MTSDAAFELSGAAGSAHALTDTNDPIKAQAKARTGIFGIRSSPLVDAVESDVA
jgi:hypothetical protein